MYFISFCLFIYILMYLFYMFCLHLCRYDVFLWSHKGTLDLLELMLLTLVSHPVGAGN